MPYYTCAECGKTYEKREPQENLNCIFCGGGVKMIAANRGEMMHIKEQQQRVLDEIRLQGLAELRRKEEAKREQARKEAKLRFILLSIAIPVVILGIVFASLFDPVIKPAYIYYKGTQALKQGEYQQAVAQFNQILTYKDSSYLLQKNAALGIAGAQVGDVVYFGRYEQDNRERNGTELIAWQVVRVEDGRALLMTQKAIENRPYNKLDEDTTWETCDLRAWLNGEFYEQAFNNTEKGYIQLTHNENPDNAMYGTDGGEDTDDNVFVLSFQEAQEYFGNRKERKAGSTAYALAHGAYQYNTTLTGAWWLRTPGTNSSFALFVDFKGNMKSVGSSVVRSDCPVRPAVWVTLGGAD